jgi:protein-S-isoprenylcysteine O-methyltransferase Ste14
MGLHRDHELVTHGPYRFVRHPMNVTMPVFGVGLLFLSANALLGVVTIVLLAIICLMRSPIEERQLRERFGEAYLAYAARTGRYFPRLRRGR